MTGERLPEVVPGAGEVVVRVAVGVRVAAGVREGRTVRVAVGVREGRGVRVAFGVGTSAASSASSPLSSVPVAASS